MHPATFLDGRRVHLENKLTKVLNEANALNERIRHNHARDDEAILYELKLDMLDRVRKALGRIQEGTYGICLDCSQPIPDTRLERMPDSPTCVPCAHRRSL